MLKFLQLFFRKMPEPIYPPGGTVTVECDYCHTRYNLRDGQEVTCCNGMVIGAKGLRSYSKGGGEFMNATRVGVRQRCDICGGKLVNKACPECDWERNQ